MNVSLSRGIVVNAPEFFADPSFQAWLDNDNPKFTWHRGGVPGDWSDVIVLVDPSLSGEGSDSDMPAAIWEQIVELCRTHLGPVRGLDSHYVVHLTNLDSAR